MADMKDKAKDAMNAAEDKAHELKGKVDQKRKDMRKDKGNV